MKPEEPVELSLKAREILRAHSALRPPDGSQQRVLSRLEQTLGFSPPAPPSPAAPAPKLAAGGAGAKAAGLLLLIGGLGSVGLALKTPGPAASLPASTASQSALPAVSSSSSPGESPPEEITSRSASISPPLARRPASTAPPRASVPSAASVAAPVAASAPPAASSSPPVSTLAEERALLSSARSALMSGQGAAALRLLNEHAQRFPAGRLSEERESLIIQALARTGNMSAARQRFEAFRARSPRSIFLPALQAAVGVSP